MSDLETLWMKRRSVVILNDDEVRNELVENLGKVEAYSDVNLLKAVKQTCEKLGRKNLHIEALSLEVSTDRTKKFESNDLAVTFRHSVCLPQSFSRTELSGLVELSQPSGSGSLQSVSFLDGDTKEGEENSEDVQSIPYIDDDEIAERNVESKVEGHNSAAVTHFYHPLAGKKDITAMTGILEESQSSLCDGAHCLRRAMKIILIQSARQLVLSYRNILIEEVEMLQLATEEEERRRISQETVTRLVDVSIKISDLAVEYLKNASNFVVEHSVAQIEFSIENSGINDNRNEESQQQF